MRLFRRRDPGPPSGAASPSESRSPGADGEDDWRTYDRVAESYARIQAPAFARPARDLVELLRIPAGARVLDVGTGTGVAARAAAERAGPEGIVVGIDPSLPMLAQARAATEGAAAGRPRYAAAEAIDLPFHDGTFDVVTATFVLSHFRRYETALFDILRVLRRGGRMGVTTWGAGDARDEFRDAWRGVAEEFAERRILSDALARAIPFEERFADRDALKQTLHDAGLRDIWVERRDYRVEMSRQDWLAGRETAAMGRFLRQMLGDGLWDTFRRRVDEVFADRFPDRFSDFRDVTLAYGHKP